MAKNEPVAVEPDDANGVPEVYEKQVRPHLEPDRAFALLDGQMVSSPRRGLRQELPGAGAGKSNSEGCSVRELRWNLLILMRLAVPHEIENGGKNGDVLRTAQGREGGRPVGSPAR